MKILPTIAAALLLFAPAAVDAAVSTIPSITVTATVTLPVTTTSANVTIPTTGSPTIALITNLSQTPVFLVFGTSSSVVATYATGIPLMGGATIVVTIGSYTWLAAILNSGSGAVNITVGT